MKKITLFVTIVMLALFVMSCASAPAGSLLGGVGPTMSPVNGNSSKVGVAESTVWLGMFGTITYPTIQTAAQNGGITRIATVEYYAQPGFLGLSTTFKTIVTGE